MDESEKKHRQEIMKQSNAAAITYSDKAVLYAFYLNGGAATALFARADSAFFAAAALFAWGAFWAVICMGLTYFVQSLITASWDGDKPSEKIRISFIINFTIPYWVVEKFRLLAILPWGYSMYMFYCGISLF